VNGGSSMLEDQLRARGDWLGASCIPLYRDAGFVFAAHVDHGAVEISGIGGKVDPGETFAGAAAREFQEETGIRVELVPISHGRRLGLPAEAFPIPTGAAALIALRPDAHPNGGRLWISVFLGRLAVPPRPVEKVRYFAIVRADARAVDLDTLWMLDGDAVRPAHAVLPVPDRPLRLRNTAAAVLATPELLVQWSSQLRSPSDASFVHDRQE